MSSDRTTTVIITVQVHPRSQRDALAIIDAVVHVWVMAPPVEGAANAAIIQYLAKTLGIPKSRLAVVRGATTRHKRIAITGLTEAEVREKLGG